MLRVLCIATVVCISLISHLHAAIIVEVGHHQLQPNQDGQMIPIQVTSDGSPTVSGFNMVAQLGDGAGAAAEPVFSGTEGTREGVDYTTGTIWPADMVNESGTGPVGSFPEFVTASVTLSQAGQDVVANGLLATLKVDTSGFSSGVFPLLLSESQGNDSNFVLPDGSEFAPEIRNGSIEIIPEPSTLTLITLAITFALVSGRRRSV